MANPEGEPVWAVQQYLDAFNKGDANAMAAMCANPMSILDGMAPHVWHGPTATQDWYKDVLVEGEHLGAKDYHAQTGAFFTVALRKLPAGWRFASWAWTNRRCCIRRRTRDHDLQT